MWIETFQTGSLFSLVSHSPYGGCGLKLLLLLIRLMSVMSLPVWGVWIETLMLFNTYLKRQSLPVWGVWIETSVQK